MATFESNRPGKSSPLETVRAVLDDYELQPQEFEGGSGYIMALADDLYEGAVAHVLEDQDQFVFYIEFGVEVPPERRAEVAEFLTRANNGILIGNFEMDYDDGRVLYRSSVDYDGTELSPELVQNVIIAAQNGADAFGSYMVEVAVGRMSAKDAVAAAEAAMDQEHE